MLRLTRGASARWRQPARSAPGRVRQAGQTLPLLCLFMVGLLGVAGAVVDLGNAYLRQQEVQRVADAAALAGAAAIPSGNYQSAAQAMAAKSDLATDQVTVALNNSDTVAVTVKRTVTTSFLHVLGINSIAVSATAKATIEAIGQVQGHVAPYAVPQQTYANGTGTVLFNENAPGAYGTIDLPTTDNTTGGSCAGNTNKGTPTNIGQELSDQLPAGTLVLGGCLSVKSGASQPSGNVVNNIAPGNDMMSKDLQSLGNGLYQIVPEPWDDANGLPPRLMYIPIVSSLPGGNGNATIINFAWFYVTSATGGGNTLTINGQWVSVQLPSIGTTSAYQPGVQGQVLAVELTQ
jgi:Flp pilus assembly protein TadG